MSVNRRVFPFKNDVPVTLCFSQNFFFTILRKKITFLDTDSYCKLRNTLLSIYQYRGTLLQGKFILTKCFNTIKLRDFLDKFIFLRARTGNEMYLIKGDHSDRRAGKYRSRIFRVVVVTIFFLKTLLFE